MKVSEEKLSEAFIKFISSIASEPHLGHLGILSPFYYFFLKCYFFTIHYWNKVIYKCFVLKFNDKSILCKFLEKLLELY